MAHPYIYPSRVLVYNLINDTNGTRYHPSDVTLQNVRAVSNVTDRNTAVDIVGNVDEGFEGQITGYYNRVNLAVIFQKCVIKIPWQGQSSTLELAAVVNAQYGTKLSEEDIELSYFNPNTLPLEIVLTAKADSFAFTGAVTVNVIPFSQSLDEAIMQQVVIPFDYPTLQSVKGQGPLYLRPYTFDTYWNFLKGLTVGEQTGDDSVTLQTLINGVLPSTQQWTLSNTAGIRNLRSSTGTTGTPTSKVLYTGVPLTQYTHRLGVDRILVLDLSSTLCTGFAGFLVMHFNDPTVDIDDAMVNKDIGRVIYTGVTL